jgi:hypothetical protein
MLVNDRDETVTDRLSQIHSPQHLQQLLIRYKVVPRKRSPLPLQVFFETLANGVNSGINFADLFDGAATGAGSEGLITDPTVEGQRVSCHALDYFLPLGLPTAELFVFLGQKLQRRRARIKERLVLAPKRCEIEDKFGDLFHILIVFDESFGLVLNYWRILAPQHRIEMCQVALEGPLQFFVLSE